MEERETLTASNVGTMSLGDMFGDETSSQVAPLGESSAADGGSGGFPATAAPFKPGPYEPYQSKHSGASAVYAADEEARQKASPMHAISVHDDNGARRVEYLAPDGTARNLVLPAGHPALVNFRTNLEQWFLDLEGAANSYAQKMKLAAA